MDNHLLIHITFVQIAKAENSFTVDYLVFLHVLILEEVGGQLR